MILKDLFQDSCHAAKEPHQMSRYHEIDEMTSGMENLCLNSALSPVNKIWQSKITKRPNSGYYNQYVTNYDK